MDDRKPSPPSRFARLRRKCATSCYVALSLWLFLASTVLATLGLVLLLALIITGVDLASFFAHLQNLSSHYLSAEPAARAKFERNLVTLLVVLVSLLIIARAPTFAARLHRELDGGERG